MEVDDEQQRTRREADKEKELGNQAYKNREFETALAHYAKAMELDPTNMLYWLNRSAVYFETGDFDKCIKDCEDAVEKGREMRADFKQIAKALGRIGNAYLKQDRLDDAIKYFNKSLSEHRTPDVLAKLRETEKVKETREKEQYISPELAEAEREKGNELFKKGMFAEAVGHYSEAIKRNPKDPRNYTNRAACYVKLLSFPQAMRDCDDALKIDPKFVKAYIRKAAACLAQKDHATAMELCEQASMHDTDRSHATEIQDLVRKCTMAMYEQQSKQPNEETVKNAMRDPEVQEILADPVMRQILEQMSRDPTAAMEYGLVIL